MATYDNTTRRQKADGSRAASERQTPNLRPQTTGICAKIVGVWRASPPPRAWVVALAFLMIDGFILVQAYDAGLAAGFSAAELSR